MQLAIIKSASRVIRWFRRKPKVSPGPPPAGKIVPITERYRLRPAPERERFGERLWSSGFVARDGILRVFFNEAGVAVELEVNGVTLDLRETNPFPIHPKWVLAKELVHAWLRTHGMRLRGDFAWVKDIWI